MGNSVLIVEDCAPIAAILSRHLASAGYRTAMASDGKEALDAVAREAPDCILLDLMLQGGENGTEVLHTLRRNAATAAIPVVVVSAKVGAGTTHLRSEVEAVGSVGKPFTREQILQAVRTALGKARPPSR